MAAVAARRRRWRHIRRDRYGSGGDGSRRRGSRL